MSHNWTIQRFFAEEISNIDGDAKIWLGFGAVEDYEGEAYEYEGYISSTNYTNDFKQYSWYDS